METPIISSYQTRISVVVVLLFIFGWMSVNIYLPALPSLSHDLNTTPEDLKLSLTLFLLGFAISQLIWGPISEKYGRKYPIILGLIISNIGIIMAMVAWNISIFNAGRFIEAVGLGCAPVLGRAMLTDSLNARNFVNVMAYGTISSNIMPALAPVIGGYLLIWFGWRSIFAFLLMYGLILFSVLMSRFPETHHNIQRDIKISQTFKHYIEAFTHRKFIGYLMPYVIASGGMIGYYTVTPFIFITKLHLLPSNYGYLSAVTVATYILGAVISQWVSPRLGTRGTVLFGTKVLLFSSVIFFIFALLTNINIYSIIIPMSIFTLGAGIIAPNSNAGGMDALRHKAGAAAGVVGFLLYLISSILSTIITALPLSSLWPIALYIIIVSCAAFLIFSFMVKKE